MGAGLSVRAMAPQTIVVRSFDADYYLTRDPGDVAKLKVREKIVVDISQADKRFGIERTLPSRYQGHSLDLWITGVTNDSGQAIPYSTESNKDTTKLVIGDSRVLVHGKQTYIISYDVRGAVTGHGGYDEFEWEVNGTTWAGWTGRVTARVHAPGELRLRDANKQRCELGGAGKNVDVQCTINQIRHAQETTITATAEALAPQQSLRVVAQFVAGTFAPYSPDPAKALHTISLVAVLGVLPTLLLALVVWRIRMTRVR